MSAKHTPGPWCAVEGTVFKDYGDKAYPVASVEGWGEDTDHNARLIAAAPTMYEALQAYDAWADKTPPADKELKALREQMRAAIAKAEAA